MTVNSGEFFAGPGTVRFVRAFFPPFFVVHGERTIVIRLRWKMRFTVVYEFRNQAEGWDR